ncbi:MAG: DUF1799 domain-containing protein [Gammaproteobacteria bacterium]|nr:DUF1799 domain-containing protein [Gammaproteobacteria bacterium]
MKASGYEPEDFEDEVFEVWGPNWPAVKLFYAVQTQWRVVMGGCTGLDYSAVFATMDRLFREMDDAGRDALFADLQVMEGVALEEMAKKK